MGEDEMMYVDGGALTTTQKGLIITCVASSFGISADVTTATIKWIIKKFLYFKL